MASTRTSLKPGEEIHFKEEPIYGKGTTFIYEGYFDIDSQRLYTIRTGAFTYNIEEDDLFRCLGII